MKLQLNEFGYLADFESWTRETALQLAKDQECELIAESWKVIYALREHYAANKRAPELSLLCKMSGETLQRIFELFPAGPAAGACKVAGLPRPTGCI